MENYGNSTVKVLGMFHAFLRWKERVYKQLFYVTDCDRSPNLLSRDACYTLGVLKPCYTVERTPGARPDAKPQKPRMAPKPTCGSDAPKLLHQHQTTDGRKLSDSFQETVNFTESAERLPIDKAGHSSCVF